MVLNSVAARETGNGIRRYGTVCRGLIRTSLAVKIIRSIGTRARIKFLDMLNDDI
jgi:hypothetical protein